MNRFKGTPAPWSQLPEESDKPYIRIRGTNIGCRYKIANVLTPCYDGVKSREADETRANARLIASAPELLDALIEMQHNGRKQGWDDKYESSMEKTRLVIAKALGEIK